MPESKEIPNHIKFLTGGVSGMTATCLVQPMDLVKTRMQMASVGRKTKKYKNSFGVLVKVIQNEGILKCWSGLSAALLRQATYTTTRMGIYQVLNDLYKYHVQPVPNVSASITMALVAGAAGAYVGNPAEVVLIRMTTDGKLPVAERRNYKNLTDALIRILREEGIAGLWRGSLPTIGRGVVVNVCQLASYSQVKNYFHEGPLQMQDGFGLHAAASSISGLLTSTASMPLDIAKTRIQNMKTPPGAKPVYSGTIDVLLKILTNEGFFALWKGFMPYFSRVTRHTIFTFVFLEQYNNLYRKYMMDIESF